jgi:hypothetical protein
MTSYQESNTTITEILRRQTEAQVEAALYTKRAAAGAFASALISLIMTAVTIYWHYHL